MRKFRMQPMLMCVAKAAPGHSQAAGSETNHGDAPSLHGFLWLECVACASFRMQPMLMCMAKVARGHSQAAGSETNHGDAPSLH